MSVAREQRLDYGPLRPELLEEIMVIEQEAYPEPWSRGMFLDELRSPRSYFCLVYLRDRLIGYGGFWHVLEEAHVTSVTIAKALRGHGYGRELMYHLLDTARYRDIRQVTLEVRESNRVARTLYESLGFRRAGLRKGYYSSTGEDALIMTKDFGGSGA